MFNQLENGIKHRIFNWPPVTHLTVMFQFWPGREAPLFKVPSWPGSSLWTNSTSPLGAAAGVPLFRCCTWRACRACGGCGHIGRTSPRCPARCSGCSPRTSPPRSRTGWRAGPCRWCSPDGYNGWCHTSHAPFLHKPTQNTAYLLRNRRHHLHVTLDHLLGFLSWSCGGRDRRRFWTQTQTSRGFWEMRWLPLSTKTHQEEHFQQAVRLYSCDSLAQQKAAMKRSSRDEEKMLFSPI